VPSCQTTPSPLSLDSSSADDEAFAAGNLFDLERRAGVANNVPDVGVFPIEARDLVKHDFSIYEQRIYRGNRLESRASGDLP